MLIVVSTSILFHAVTKITRNEYVQNPNGTPDYTYINTKLLSNMTQSASIGRNDLISHNPLVNIDVDHGFNSILKEVVTQITRNKYGQDPNGIPDIYKH